MQRREIRRGTLVQNSTLFTAWRYAKHHTCIQWSNFVRCLFSRLYCGTGF